VVWYLMCYAIPASKFLLSKIHVTSTLIEGVLIVQQTSSLEWLGGGRDF